MLIANGDVNGEAVKKMNIGIIGQGFVGNAIFQKFRNFYNVLTFDIVKKKCNSNFSDVASCKYIFICLPTPMKTDGSCDISLVENMIKRLSVVNKSDGFVLKSTVPPGTTDYFNNKYSNIKIVFNPEFLTERNAVEDYENQKRIILGGPRPLTSDLKQIFTKVFPQANIIKTGSGHAEMVKYLTNCFLATKVSFANEIYKLCEKLNLDYDKVIEYALFDDRLGKSHWNVPGHDGDFGFGGHCFPKDLNAILELSKKLESPNNILKAALKTNDKVRKNRDWEKMKGRAVN